jgi:superfamily II DNA or RNA helicase
MAFVPRGASVPSSSPRAPRATEPAAALDGDSAVLAALALAARPMNRTTWMQVLGFANVRNGTRVITTTQLRDRAAAWCDAGVLVGEDDRYGLSPHARHRLLVELHATNQLERYFGALSGTFSPYGRGAVGSPELHVAAARMSLYAHRHDELRQSLEAYCRSVEYSYRYSPSALADVLGPEPPPEALALLPRDLFERYFVELSGRALQLLVPPPSNLLEAAAQLPDGSPALVGLLVCAALRGDLDHAERLEERTAKVVGAEAGLALAELVRGRKGPARELAQRAHEAAPKSQRGRATWLSQPLTPWLSLLLATSPDPHQVQLGQSVLEAAFAARYRVERDIAYHALLAFRRYVDKGGGLETSPDLFQVWGRGSPEHEWLERVFGLLALRWVGADEQSRGRVTLHALPEHVERLGLRWLAGELRALEAGGEVKSTLRGLYEPRPAWEGKLALVEHLLGVEAPSAAAPAAPASARRLVWEVDLSPLAPEPITARLQAQTDRGWSRGQPISARKLAEARDSAADWLDDGDRAVLRHLVVSRERGAGQHVLMRSAFVSLCGHPRVALAELPGSFVTLALRKPKLVVERKDTSIALQILPERCSLESLVVERDADQIAVYSLDPSQHEVARALAGGLTLPEASEARVGQLLARASAHFEVASDVTSADVTEAPADARIHARLWRGSVGIRGRLLVQPLAGADRFCRPGRGQATILAEVGGVRRQACRDLAAELEREAALLAACPALAATERDGDDFVARELVAALEVLLELQAAGDAVVVHWPEGTPLRVHPERRARDVRLSIGSVRDLLTLDGEMAVAPELQLKMSELLAAASAPQGRFIPLGPDEFVALEHDVLRRLQHIAAAGNERGGRVELSLSMAALLDDWREASADLKVSSSAARVLDRVREAHLLAPEPPDSLAARLRPYQRDGFEWLSRLAHWGAGACLCDDMGLGKTLQILALLLARASQGPALVVAPTSVCQGWHAEAQRFATRLTVHRFRGAERSTLLESLGPHDVLLVSYGVMQNEIDALANIEFSTVVLDEAQAIKNPAAQRTQAARRLRGAFRIAATGTPIENHLGELWSLLHFVNPGMLGSAKRFDQRFARPIAAGDRRSAELLRRLVSPFLLRRTKGEVAAELPAKTEIILHVELGAEERALYETIRQRALRELDAGPAAQQRFRILAELTRLRRAACHPDLVAPEGHLPSAKLAAFQALVDELREGGHRALVFSQFVDHLDLVRAWLVSSAIPHQYLVGATPENERARSISAFQHGNGDVFLISLKAGGFGLNLTQADYVIILDPWWNPAAEDQAADRAHRIGQLRPVTIYRLVAKDTVEERIIALHQQKRNLADSLLEGMAEAGTLDLDALRGLLAEA